jgi:hypothetical protein
MAVSIVIELTGHIIDSLTLAKVIDKIQMTGFDYQVNDLRVGQGKSDISQAQLSIWAPSQEDLDLLLDELRVYGALALREEPPTWLICQQAGKAPTGSHLRCDPQTQVFINETMGWTDVKAMDHNHVIVLKENQPMWQSVSKLVPGDQVAALIQGIRVAPIRHC